MKSLPYIALLLLGIQSVVFADTYTSGRVKLTLPTTGYLDVNKRLDVKYKENYLWISTALNAIDASISTNVTNLQSQINTINSTISTNNDSLNVYKTTAQIWADNFSYSTQAFKMFVTTHTSMFNSVSDSTKSYAAFLSSAQIMIEYSSSVSNAYNLFSPSVTARLDSVKDSTSSYGLFLPSATIMIQYSSAQANSYSLSIGSIQARLDGLSSSTPTFIYKSTDIIPNMTIRLASGTIDQFTANSVTATTLSGQVMTAVSTLSMTGVTAGAYTNTNLTVDSQGRITVASNGSSSGVDTVIRFATITIGMLGRTDVDIASNTINGWNEALKRLNALGLTTSATGYGAIMYMDGLYNMFGATVPIGVNVYAFGSSAVWINNQVSGMLTIHGLVRGICIDGGMKSTTLESINVSTGGRLEECTIYGFENQQSAAVGRRSFGVNLANNVRIYKNKFIHMNPCAGVAYYGDVATFKIVNSSNVDISFNEFRFKTAAAATNVLFAIENSTNIRFHDNDFYARAVPLVLGGTVDIYIERNNFFIDGTLGVEGVIALNATSPGTLGISTRTYVNDNKFFVNTNETASLIRTHTLPVQGAVFNGNSAYCKGTNSVTMFTIGAGSMNSIFTDNYSDRCSVMFSDSGKSSRYTTNDNFKDGIEQ